jgi:D-alanyl-lipoteichoic acid acyltransferase DltB (MBOAT superfamily)
MLFNSLEFLAFFPLVVGVYFALPLRARWMFLLAASYFFYGSWRWEYVALLGLTTFVDWWVALRMNAAAAPGRRRMWLWVSVVSNLGVLLAFKYFNFFNDALRALFSAAGAAYAVPALQVLLPVGISFYTFQSLAYTVDVYRGTQRAERSLGIFALYVSFFPQLVAGPIERSQALLPQLRQRHRPDLDRWASGLTRMAWGFFKKLVIADRLALYVDAVYAQPGAHGGWTVLIATYCFAFQIYCDFSGYTDIAIGAARVLGIQLMENFRAPYAARSIREFWRRWHISLTTWFRDYVYIPLGGNRGSRRRWYAAVIGVFVFSGLWHGANWTFLVWGLLHGCALLASLAVRGARARAAGTAASCPAGGWRARARNAVATLLTFHFVCLAWVFFRANSVADAGTLLRSLADFSAGPLAALRPQPGWYGLAVAAVGVAVMLWVERGGAAPETRLRPASGPAWVRWAYAYAVIFAILMLGEFRLQEFIYFQF